jgi:hypothetical protein
LTIKLAFTGFTDSEIEFIAGWPFIFFTLAVIFGNVLNLLPLAFTAYRRLRAKKRYDKAW